MRRRAAFAIFVGGGIAATLDIAYALTFWFFYHGVAPVAVLHTIAGGLLGLPTARAGGAATALLALGLHYAIAMCMAAAFFIIRMNSLSCQFGIRLWRVAATTVRRPRKNEVVMWL